MALMGTRIDKRTIAGLASQGTATYAHGLPGAPDSVSIRFLNVGLTAALAWNQVHAVEDATNITLQNAGAGASQNMEVTAIVYHSAVA